MTYVYCAQHQVHVNKTAFILNVTNIPMVYMYSVSLSTGTTKADHRNTLTVRECECTQFLAPTTDKVGHWKVNHEMNNALQWHELPSSIKPKEKSKICWARKKKKKQLLLSQPSATAPNLITLSPLHTMSSGSGCSRHQEEIRRFQEATEKHVLCTSVQLAAASCDSR